MKQFLVMYSSMSRPTKKTTTKGATETFSETLNVIIICLWNDGSSSNGWSSLALMIILRSYDGFNYAFSSILFLTFHLISNDFAQKSNEENVMCFFSNAYIIKAFIEVAIFFPPLWKELRTVSQILKRWPCKNSSHWRRTQDCKSKKTHQDNE